AASITTHQTPTGHAPHLVHVDAYRLTNKDELTSLDLETSLDNSVVVIEWGRGMADALATSHLDIELQRPGVASDQLLTDFSDTDVDEHRTAVITGYGPRWEGITIA